jgi:hypothetical protein
MDSTRRIQLGLKLPNECTMLRYPPSALRIPRVKKMPKLESNHTNSCPISLRPFFAILMRAYKLSLSCSILPSGSLPRARAATLYERSRI